jgi:phosphoribosyl 1,2-cyclic phosphate phosphodiesterase
VRVTILGCGGSSGTPAIDWGWQRCNPDNPRNRRTRPSILIESGETRLLIDTAPELRQHLLDAGVSRLAAVLYTHAHADHVHGLDDLRAVNRVIGAALPAYGSPDTLAKIRSRFAYAFTDQPAETTNYYKPTLIPRPIEDGEQTTIDAISVRAFDQDHGFSRTLGFRFDAGGRSCAYSTDLVELPDHAWAIVHDLDLWIIGAFVDRPHPTHCDVDKALAWIRRARPRRAVLTHLGGMLDYDELAARLPDRVEPAYDGLVVLL